MSYARFGERESDVYVYLAANGRLCCCACSLEGADYCSSFTATAELLEHLEEHRRAGDRVPDQTTEELTAAAAKNDAWIALPPEQRTVENYR